MKLDPHKVIALRMNASRLQKLRKARGEGWRGTMQTYSDLQRTAQELRGFNKLVADHGWRCVDVSYRATEDTASEIALTLAFDRLSK